MIEFLRHEGLSLELLESLSFESKLGLSLKNSIRHFDSAKLFNEIEAALEWFDAQGVLHDLPLDYRIKSLQSAMHKYERYYPDRPAKKVFDDLLGFRTACDNYDGILLSECVPALRIVDMSKGKNPDDGYRGVHVYYQRDNFHYPIEIQYNTHYDRQLNNWLHKYIYKKTLDTSVGVALRRQYENGKIRNEDEFVEVMHNVLRGSQAR